MATLGLKLPLNLVILSLLQSVSKKRSMNEIYKAAMKETGTLRVSWGGDGEYS